MKNFIAPSILSANFAKLGKEVDEVILAGADIIHFDVMDNHYVPNLTVGPMVCKSLIDYGVKKPIDVHLMTTPVDELITQFCEAGASMVSFHPEASQHVDRSIDLIKSKNCKAGIALNPASPLSLLDHILEKIDFIEGLDLSDAYLRQANRWLNNKNGEFTQLIRGNAEKLPLEKTMIYFQVLISTLLLLLDGFTSRIIQRFY